MADLAFFPDPQVDRLLGVVLELAGEVYALRDRMRTLEQVLAQNGVLTAEDVRDFVPSAEERAARLADRDTLIARLLAPMTATADSPAPAFERV
jgi:hypothetical protein